MTRPTVLVASHTLRHRSGLARKRLGTAPGSLLSGSRPLLARPGRPKIALGPALARPGRVPNASRRVPETALNAQNRPRPIFRRFSADFARFFGDFRAMLRRFSEQDGTIDHRIWSAFLLTVFPWVPPFLIAVVGAVLHWLGAVLALLCCPSLPKRLTKHKR